uniref:Uncharacterized protein n=1 Tax=Hippocampus comes TaxID=109280 RepID=A0A3Q2ZN08_HIPCM
MEKLEGYWMEAQSLCKAVDEHLKETQAQYQTLERKYSKAKRMIKEYQQKELEYLKKEAAQRQAEEDSEASHKEEADNGGKQTDADKVERRRRGGGGGGQQRKRNLRFGSHGLSPIPECTLCDTHNLPCVSSWQLSRQSTRKPDSASPRSISR